MDFLGIGPMELAMIFVIILLVLGPKDMIKAGRSIGDFVRKLTTSDSWQALQRARREMRTLPNKLAREAGLEEFSDGVNQIKNFDLSKNITDAWTATPPPPDPNIDQPKTPPDEEATLMPPETDQEPSPPQTETDKEAKA
jgi:Sec-independent protein translocase protein TatA